MEQALRSRGRSMKVGYEVCMGGKFYVTGFFLGKGLRVEKKNIPVFYKVSFVMYVVVRDHAKEYKW